MATRDLNIKITLQDSASKGLQGVNQTLGNIGGSATSAAGSLTKLLGPIGLAIASFQTLRKVVSEAVASVELFASFDDTMRKVGAVTRATSKELEDMTALAKEMGRTTRYTATQAAEGLTMLGMAGFNANEAMQALPNVLNLAAAGGLDLGTAADIATNVLSGFGLEVEKLSRVNDILAAAFTGSNTTLGELGDGFKYVGPIAKSVGANFEDLIASMGKLGDAGIKGSLAGTTLRGVIDALFNPTNDEIALMGELSRRIGGLGLVVKDTSGNFVGFTKLVEQLEKAGLRGDEALRLFGQRAGPGMAALLQVGSNALGDFRFELENVDQTTSNIAAAMEGGIGGAIRALKSAMEGLTLELGKAFSTISANTVLEIRDVFLELTKAVKDLAEAGLFDTIALGVTKMGKAFSTSVSLGVAYFKEYTNYAQVFTDLLNNNVEGATKRLGDVGAAFRGVLQDKGLLASDEEIQISFIDKTIASYQREIETLKEKIATDREDISGWRAKLLGAKPYIEQLDKHNAQLQEILQKVWDLNRSKLVLTAKIDLKAADKELDAGIDKALAITEKIGTGTTKASGTAAVKAVQAPLDALKVTTSKLRADLELQKAMLEANYRANIDSLDKYYESRRSIIEQQGQIEIDYLEEKSKLEADPTKRSDAEIQAYVRQQQLVIELTKLERERYDAISKLEDDRARQLDENAAKQLEIEKTLSDIKDRVRAGEQGRGLFEAQFQEEIQQLQERQGREIEILNQTEQGKARLQEYYQQANMERQQLDADQYRRVLTAKLEMTRDITGGMADTFADLYELTGEKQKEFFYLAKAAALAEVGVNTALGIMKAWSQGGIFGGVGAALIAVQGAVQTAKILSTGLAEGGEVPGYSPNSKSDNILARLTAGEYVQPVSSVKYYGTEFMEAIRRKAVPRSAIEGFNIGSIRIPRDYSFAEGGSVIAGQVSPLNTNTRKDQINIFNYTDRNEILRALASSQGASAIINVISSNREKVSRVLR